MRECRVKAFCLVEGELPNRTERRLQAATDPGTAENRIGDGMVIHPELGICLKNAQFAPLAIWRKPSNQQLSDVYLVISSCLVTNSQLKHVVQEPFRISIRLAKSLPGRLLQYAKLALRSQSGLRARGLRRP